MEKPELHAFLKKYADHCEQQIKKAYPDARVEVTYQSIPRHAIRLDSDDAQLASDVQDIVEESWNSFEFISENYEN